MYSGNGVTTLPSSIGHVWAMVWRLVEKISILPDGVASGFATGSSRNAFIPMTGLSFFLKMPCSRNLSNDGRSGTSARLSSTSQRTQSSWVRPSVNSALTPSFSASPAICSYTGTQSWSGSIALSVRTVLPRSPAPDSSPGERREDL